MKEGVILAGGEGTRLGKNRPYTKSLTLVYDKPMIEYPIQTMKDMGVDFTHIVTSPKGQAEMFANYRDAIDEMPVSYHEQMAPMGTAHALGHIALKGIFPVLCGDVYFDPAPKPSDVPTLYYHEFKGAENHSVYSPEENIIIEKPTRDIGRKAIVAYFYDERVFDIIPTLQPTERGELELIDLHNWYLQNGAEIKQYHGFFQDMGTPDGLLKVANHISMKTNGLLDTDANVKLRTREAHRAMMADEYRKRLEPWLK